MLDPILPNPIMPNSMRFPLLKRAETIDNLAHTISALITL